jgi:hypothetical protein
LVLIANIPNKYQPIKFRLSKIIENQLICGAKIYKFETIMPKSILGVADPVIMNSGFPV